MKSKNYFKIINAARSLFWKYGFKRVSVEEICQKACISKMTFYRYYPNKLVLAKAVFDQIVDEGTLKFKAIMHDESTAAHEKMEKILTLKMESTLDISREFLKDFYSSPELGLSAYVEEKSRLVWKEIINDYKIAQNKGWFRKDFKPEAFLIIVNKLNELLSEGKLIELYASPQEMIMEMARFFTYGIMPSDDHNDQIVGKTGLI